MIHLKHKDNGYHIVYTDTEAKACEKLGWERCDIAKEFAAARLAKLEAAEPAKRKRRTKAEMELANDAAIAS